MEAEFFQNGSGKIACQHRHNAFDAEDQGKGGAADAQCLGNGDDVQTGKVICGTAVNKQHQERDGGDDPMIVIKKSFFQRNAGSFITIQLHIGLLCKSTRSIVPFFSKFAIEK